MLSLPWLGVGGGQVLARRQITGIDVAGGVVRAVRIAGDETRIEADAVVNAAGAWSGRVAALAGQNVELELTKSAIIIPVDRSLRIRLLRRGRHLRLRP